MLKKLVILLQLFVVMKQRSSFPWSILCCLNTHPKCCTYWPVIREPGLLSSIWELIYFASMPQDSVTPGKLPTCLELIVLNILVWLILINYLYIPSWSSPFAFCFYCLSSIPVWAIRVFVCWCKVDFAFFPSLKHSPGFPFNLELCIQWVTSSILVWCNRKNPAMIEMLTSNSTNHKFS